MPHTPKRPNGFSKPERSDAFRGLGVGHEDDGLLRSDGVGDLGLQCGSGGDHRIEPLRLF